jgi:hypothetical protein
MCRHKRHTHRATGRFVIIVLALSAAAATVGRRPATAAPAGAEPAAKPAAKPATQPADVDKAMAAQLDRRLPEVKFEGVGFSDVIDFLRDVSGANFFVDWRRLEAAKVDRNAPTTVKLHDIKFADALAKILDQVGGKDHKVTYAASEGVLVISTPAGLDAFAATGPAAGGADPKTKAVLDRKLPGMKFDGVALADVLDFLKDVSGTPIDADWKALAAAGVDRNSPVTAKIANVTFGQALRLILWSVGPKGTDTSLTYTVRAGRIVVAPAPPAKADGPERNAPKKPGA